MVSRIEHIFQMCRAILPRFNCKGRERRISNLPFSDQVQIFTDVFAVRDCRILSPVRPCVRVDTAGRHLICPYLRRLHELVVDSQRGNTFFRGAERWFGQ